MTQMIAGGLKLGGNPDYARALAKAALMPDIADLQARNRKLEGEILELKKRRWRRNAEKIAAYEANMEQDSGWKVGLCALLLGLQSFARLLVVREE